MTALGIDLGTTYSVVATLDDRGRPTVLRNPLGEETTPSVVWFEQPGSVIVGSAARNACPAFPDRTVTLIKRWMGLDRTLMFDQVEYSPEAISALILRALVDGATPDREPTRAVVTVPAYFGIREREATQQACQLAGFDPLELVSEPVAAAVHYGFSEAVGIGTAIVFDLGGGTFDATVLRLGGRIEVVATDGDTELGGADWDDRLLTYLLDQFLAQASPTDDPRDDGGFIAELALTAERLKRALSRASSHRVPIRYGGQSVTLTVRREDFEAASADLVGNTLVCLGRLLTAAGRAGVSDIDHCLLVGGSSKMPAIAAALSKHYGWNPRLFDPDLAVAKGAALRAHQLLRRPLSERTWTPRPRDPATVSFDVGSSTRHQPVECQPADAGAGPQAADPASAGDEPIMSVVPRGFGVLVHDSSDPAGVRRYVEHVIHQNDPLPVMDGHITLATILDNQSSARIEVYEQAGAIESATLENNRPVLDGELSDIPANLPAGSPIRVSLRLGTDGRLTLVAIEPKSGASLTVEACIEGVLDGAEHRLMANNLSHLTVRL